MRRCSGQEKRHMADRDSQELADEQKLVKLYMELTGDTETCARGVFMMVQPEEVPQPELSAWEANT